MCSKSLFCKVNIALLFVILIFSTSSAEAKFCASLKKCFSSVHSESYNSNFLVFNEIDSPQKNFERNVFIYNLNETNPFEFSQMVLNQLKYERALKENKNSTYNMHYKKQLKTISQVKIEPGEISEMLAKRIEVINLQNVSLENIFFHIVSIPDIESMNKLYQNYNYNPYSSSNISDEEKENQNKDLASHNFILRNLRIAIIMKILYSKFNITNSEYEGLTQKAKNKFQNSLIGLIDNFKALSLNNNEIEYKTNVYKIIKN